MIKLTNFDDKYDLSKKIDKGSFGEVYIATSIKNKEKYACKILTIEEGELQFCVLNEIVAYQRFSHPNIVEIYDIFLNPFFRGYKLFIVMELCSENLWKLLYNDSYKFPLTEARMYIMQLISALQYMNLSGYIHNDLSFRNILFKDNQLKIIDFGFVYNLYNNMQRFSRNTMTIEPPEYAAEYPKVQLEKVDVWAIGMIYGSMITGRIIINANEKEDYYLELLNQVGIPSYSMLKKYKLVDTYHDIYKKKTKILSAYNLQLIYDLEKVNTPKEIVFIQKMYALTSLKIKKVLVNSTPDHKFAKRLLNWNVGKRPTIQKTCQLFQQMIMDKMIVNSYDLKLLQIFPRKKNSQMSINLENIIQLIKNPIIKKQEMKFLLNTDFYLHKFKGGITLAQALRLSNLGILSSIDYPRRILTLAYINYIYTTHDQIYFEDFTFCFCLTKENVQEILSQNIINIAECPFRAYLNKVKIHKHLFTYLYIVFLSMELFPYYDSEEIFESINLLTDAFYSQDIQSFLVNEYHRLEQSTKSDQSFSASYHTYITTSMICISYLFIKAFVIRFPNTSPFYLNKFNIMQPTKQKGAVNDLLYDYLIGLQIA